MEILSLFRAGEIHRGKEVMIWFKSLLSKKHEPKEVSILADYVKSWSYWRDFLVINLKKLHILQLLMKRERIPLSIERYLVLIGIFKLPQNKLSMALYDFMQGKKIVLQWRGVIKRIPSFILEPSNTVDYKENIIAPILSILNNDNSIKNYLKDLEPLSFSVEVGTSFSVEKETESNDIFWIITLRLLELPMLWMKKKILNTLILMDTIAGKILNFSAKGSS